MVWFSAVHAALGGSSLRQEVGLNSDLGESRHLGGFPGRFVRLGWAGKRGDMLKKHIVPEGETRKAKGLCSRVLAIRDADAFHTRHCPLSTVSFAGSSLTASWLLLPARGRVTRVNGTQVTWQLRRAYQGCFEVTGERPASWAFIRPGLRYAAGG